MKFLPFIFLMLFSLSSFSQKLMRAEYFIDVDPGPSHGVAITFGKADSVSLNNISVPTTGLALGAHLLGVRTQDSLGVWSASSISPFYILVNNISQTGVVTSKLVRAEYFIDVDPGPSLGTPITFAKADSISIANFSVPTLGLVDGAHLLGIRTCDSIGVWSASSISPFTILKNSTTVASKPAKLVRAEYFIDIDPGPSFGTPVTFTKSDSVSISDLSIPTTGLSIGTHLLGIRVRDSLGIWSASTISPFNILVGNNNVGKISKLVQAEYFIDTDPGPSHGTAIDFAKADSVSINDLSISTNGLSIGTHLLGIRVMDSIGVWSASTITPFTIQVGNITDTLPRKLVQGEYFFGSSDPGYGSAVAFTALPNPAESWDISSLQIPLSADLGTGINTVTFRLKQGGGLWTANQTIEFEICLNVPAKPLVSSGLICGGTGSVVLKASKASSKLYSWYASSYGGTPLKTSSSITDSTYTTPTLTASTTYWVAQKTSGCNSARTRADVTVVNILPTPTASNISRCGRGIVTLTASGAPAGGTYRWYDSVNSTVVLAEGNTYTTDTLEVSRNYAVSTISPGGLCESPLRKGIVAVISVCSEQVITFPFLNDMIFGFDDYVVLKATASSGLKVIYQIVSGPARLSGDTLFPTSIGEVTVRAKQPGNSSTLEAPYVNRTFRIVAGSATLIVDYDHPMCTGSELKFIATAIKDGQYFWSGPNGFTSTLQSPSIYNVSLADSGKYSLIVKAPNDTISTVVDVKVYKSPQKISLYSIQQQLCAKDFKLFTEGDSITSYQWVYNGKKMIGRTDSILIPTFSGGYSVIGYNNAGCSISSIPIFVNVDPDSLPVITRLRSPGRLHAPAYEKYQWFVNNLFIADSDDPEISLIFNGVYTVKVTDARGCERMSLPLTINDDALIELSREAINQNGEVNNQYNPRILEVFPVPASSLVTLKWISPFRGIVHYKIVNGAGMLLKDLTEDKDNEVLLINVNTDSWADGIYLVYIESGKGRPVTGKILVRK